MEWDLTDIWNNSTIREILTDNYFYIRLIDSFLTRNFKPDLAISRMIAIASGILATKFIVWLWMLMVLMLKLGGQKTISRHLTHEFSDISKVRGSRGCLWSHRTRASEVGIRCYSLHHHQIGCSGQTFRAAHRYFRANGQDAAAVCSTINPACASIHFVFLQVSVQVGLLAKTALAQRAPKQPHHINQSTTSINST
jgi:hypothetical protein